jgi:hypothetical protein
LTNIVVCSRSADYDALTNRLNLGGAVVLQPLTPAQIDDYLSGTGDELLAVKETLPDDAHLQELAKSPLILSIMTLVFKGKSVRDLHALDTIEARRKHLFDAYIQGMFDRRGTDLAYTPEQTIHGLGWLARKMSQYAQTEFLLESLQPDWLDTRTQRRLYQVICGLTVGLLGGLIVGLLGGKIVGLSGGLTVGLKDRWFDRYYSRYRGAQL